LRRLVGILPGTVDVDAPLLGDQEQAVFPAGFAPTLDWNRRFAEAALRWVRARDADAYFMPIRVGVADWLGGLL
jgi:methylenetetrahydrofolate reductase (NADPH)